jgi:hypothetical protein
MSSGALALRGIANPTSCGQKRHPRAQRGTPVQRKHKCPEALPARQGDRKLRRARRLQGLEFGTEANGVRNRCTAERCLHLECSLCQTRQRDIEGQAPTLLASHGPQSAAIKWYSILKGLPHWLTLLNGLPHCLTVV